MKRGDVQAWTMYATPRGGVVAVLSTDVLWQEEWRRQYARRPEPMHPLRLGKKPDTHSGFPAAKRVWPWNSEKQRPAEIPEWEPTVVIPRDLIAPLDEHERAEQEKETQRKADEAERERTIADRRQRVAALLDVLPLDHGQQAALGRLHWNSTVPENAEVSLEWLEGVAARLREAQP